MAAAILSPADLDTFVQIVQSCCCWTSWSRACSFFHRRRSPKLAIDFIVGDYALIDESVQDRVSIYLDGSYQLMPGRARRMRELKS